MISRLELLLNSKIMTVAKSKNFYDQFSANERDSIHKIEIGLNGLNIDLIRHSVTVDQNEIRLTNLEFNLLFYLASQPGFKQLPSEEDIQKHIKKD